jgi:hypothetical protein
LKIYIGASWGDRLLVKEVCEILENYGIRQMEDWWTHIDRGKWRQYAISDRVAVRQAGVFILYNGDKKTSGKMIEFGMAIEREIPIWSFGNKINSVFRYFIKKHFDLKDAKSIAGKIIELVEGIEK